MPSHQELQLQGDIRQALENYHGDYVSGKYWDQVIESIARIVAVGSVELADMVQLDLALRHLSGAPVEQCGCGELKY